MTITIDHDDLCTLLAGLNAMIRTIYDLGVDVPEELEADYHGDWIRQEAIARRLAKIAAEEIRRANGAAPEQ